MDGVPRWRGGVAWRRGVVGTCAPWWRGVPKAAAQRGRRGGVAW